MKKLLTAVTLVVMISASAFAFPMIQEGAREIDVSFYLRDGDWSAGLGYGIFVTDEVLLGAKVDYVDWADIWAIGGMAEYNWNMGTMTVPYAAGIVSYADYDVSDSFLFGPKVGVKQFITDYLAIDLNAQYLFSDDSDYDEDLEVSAGLRVLF